MGLSPGRVALPRDPASNLRIHSLQLTPSTAQAVAHMSFTSSLARVYALQRTDGLEPGHTWGAVTTERRGREGADAFVHTNPAPAHLTGMYRLTVRLP